MTGRYVEDYTVGEVIVAPAVEFTEDFIIDFAKVYDPQAIHIDKDYAVNEGSFGGLIASGFQTLAASFSSFIQMGYFKDVSLGGPGMDEIRWVKPVRPGDTLTPSFTVAEARKSKTKPDRGIVHFNVEVRNQDGDTVLTFTSMTMIKTRNG
ncbi:MAG: acyl dehydratase [Rhodospirillaceae bacterium]|jgi:acyl dehydratase|uniref:MaoC family dehydratase n=1 Tax=Hwanghaeella sp. 1Z406 TaxID=3402811 RepID=UPI000C4E4156|nr:acyl dehydratase [Rhodospirillales bacterium]MAX47129.1 acyl dehydratase [Rhodospirillaceae bacterium]|tara:strand:+ start:5159 stop:5611 length:453 start_codon:yes stop_codon:yes gene_type:complete